MVAIRCTVLGEEPLTAVTVERIESWKARRLNAGRSAATVLRDLFTLSSVLRRTVRAGELTDNPVRRVDKPRIDRRGKVRFLDQAEESRLRDALKARDEEMQNRRTAANERRQKRHKELLPRLRHFGTGPTISTATFCALISAAPNTWIS